MSFDHFLDFAGIYPRRGIGIARGGVFPVPALRIPSFLLMLIECLRIASGSTIYGISQSAPLPPICIMSLNVGKKPPARSLSGSFSHRGGSNYAHPILVMGQFTVDRLFEAWRLDHLARSMICRYPYKSTLSSLQSWGFWFSRLDPPLLYLRYPNWWPEWYTVERAFRPGFVGGPCRPPPTI